MLLDIPLSPLQSLGTFLLAAAEKLLGTSSSLPLQSAQYRWELFWLAALSSIAYGRADSSRGGAGPVHGLPRAGTPGLFVPPAASETFISCIKCCFQSAFWRASGSVSAEWEIQAAYKTLTGLTSQPAWAG